VTFMYLYREIKKNFILPNAYNDWKEYRNAVTDYVIEETNQVNVPLTFSSNMDETSLLPTLAIVGAGACNDLNLCKLTSHFSKITLLDCDSDAIHTALQTYHLQDCSQIECQVISLNGLHESHYEAFCDQLQAYVQEQFDTLTPEQFEAYAISLLQKYLYETQNYIIPLPAHTYDYICCFGVHSQLQAMFSYIYKAFEINLREIKFADAPNLNSHFNSYLQAENERFIPLFHDALFNCAKQGVFLGLEKKRTNNDDAIEGAYQGIIDIQKRNLTTKCSSVVWPFLPSEDIYYEMLLFNIQLPQK